MIYIVEDDKDIREIESYALINAGFTVKTFEEGGCFLKEIEKELPELVILDIMLPGRDGMELLKRLRNHPKTNRIPILMLTAKTMEIDKVKALDAGADDYLTKPFGVMEFISRVKALLRRSTRMEEKETLLLFETIKMDVEKHLVIVKEEPCKLTFKEFELLHYFLQNPGIVLSRDKLMERVWGFDFEGETRTVDMHIKTLRQKLGKAGGLIITVRNVGYKLDKG